MDQADEALAAKLHLLLSHLDERQRRLWLGAEARLLGMAVSDAWPGLSGSRRARCRAG